MVRSSPCVVRVATNNCPEFQALCDSLRRNDPTVTTVATHRSSTPDGYGRRLGEALLSSNNSVVSEIDLYLSFFLSESDRQGETTNIATPLLTWMEQSSSLQKVTLHARYGTSYEFDRYSPIDQTLLQRAVNAVKMNPNIQVFHSYLGSNAVPLPTEYLSTSDRASALKSLRVEIPERLESEFDQLAQAIAALSNLKELWLACTIDFLKILPAQTTSLLRELGVQFGYGSSSEASNVALFSSILSSSKKIKRVTIEQLMLINENWNLIQSGLQANPSITHLKLNSCVLLGAEAASFVSQMQSSEMTSHQNVQHLELSVDEIGCLSTTGDTFESSPRLAQMLCGSLLQQVTFDFRVLQEHRMVEFFAILSANSSAVRLRSMHLQGQRLWDMYPYLSSTVHLRHFTFTCGNREFSVPSTFLRGLRHNGSLHTVEFKDQYGQLYSLSDDVGRFIQACTTRNRELANAMTSCFHAATHTNEANEQSDTNRDHDGASTTGTKQFPAFCRVSHQAERMAPNSMLLGLLVSSDELDTMSSSSILDKRVATEAVEDV